MTILRARTVVTMDGPPLEDGGVAVDSGRIVAVGPFHEIAAAHANGADVIDLGEKVLLPGLINAHCHLDYTSLRNAIAPPKSFAQWITRINALKRQMADEDYLKAIADGFVELKRWGTTTVCNLEAFPELLPRIPTPPIRTWWFMELIDIRSRVATEGLLQGALSFFEGREGWLGGFGLNPHAPYTASAELFRLCTACSERFGMLLTTHVAESSDEESFFRHGRGELFDLLTRIGRGMDDCGKGSAFSTALSSGLIGPGWILAHANELDDNDLALIAATPGEWHIVHCPRSHTYFQHRPFRWRELQALGVGISVGTDSLASNDSLSLFAELRAAQKSAPWLTSEDLMKTVTVNPARALKKSGELGAIVPGAHADLIAIPYAGAATDVYEAIISNQRPIEWMMLDGKL